LRRHWKQVLRQSEPLLRRYRLRVGIENHKDWLADEQVEILKSVSSPWLGACVDFGNNLALLEDSLEVVRKLAPYAVTTHLEGYGGASIAKMGLNCRRWCWVRARHRCARSSRC
jgi:sugar phosphate isomerase/epimerase